MLPLERRNWLEQQILTHGKIDIEDLSKQLNVSSMTIRRDLKELENENKVIRTHGGAISPDSLITEVPYSSKKGKNINEKRSIALRASSIIKQGSTIILDSGTTTLELAKLLKSRDDLTIVTNDIKIAGELVSSLNKVIVTGGEMQKELGTLFGAVTQQILKVIHADLFFLGAHAVDINHGVTAPTFDKSLIKQMMIDASQETWLLADYSKFSKRAFSSVCSFSDLEGLITDLNIDSSLSYQLETKIPVLYGGES
ncbi:transcriptional regulator, DeoR family [Lentibacillus halodurans]|uniref:Transcriptional regulator, DeoR family n=1 Tax=Lentibacillus halodurans TaxID=237679 RepID=A0A1I0XM76_9BACI|nr:DeoR/GlpR family DNA-binding transcription regulator [Lentibacillus halodurans]SFB01536.1 transcriptional regulator, DeoR family [Lentibacillus halodurans]